MHRNLTYLIVVVYLVDAENQGLLVVGKEVDEYGVELVGSDVVLLHVVVGYRSRNHICDAVEVVEEWLHRVFWSEGTKLELSTIEHVVLIEVEYRHNDIVLA